MAAADLVSFAQFKLLILLVLVLGSSPNTTARGT